MVCAASKRGIRWGCDAVNGLIKPSELGEIGPWALMLLVLAGLVYLVTTGMLVPRSTVERDTREHQAEIDRLLDSWERRLAEAVQRERDWRDAYAAADRRAELAAGQVSQLLVFAGRIEGSH